jgi:hypothetical protein
MVAAKNSRNRRAAGSPAAAITRGTAIDAAVDPTVFAPDLTTS